MLYFKLHWNHSINEFFFLITSCLGFSPLNDVGFLNFLPNMMPKKNNCSSKRKKINRKSNIKSKDNKTRRLKKRVEQKRKNYLQDAWNRAVTSCQQGVSIRKAADTFGVPRSTLSDAWRALEELLKISRYHNKVAQAPQPSCQRKKKMTLWNGYFIAQLGDTLLRRTNCLTACKGILIRWKRLLSLSIIGLYVISMNHFWSGIQKLLNERHRTWC